MLRYLSVVPTLGFEITMGAELVGMNGVISNVINILSVTELGISTAIVYHLYGALARKDEHEIASLMNLYRKAYRIFAVIVFTAFRSRA